MKDKYIEKLEELQSLIESEIRITKEANEMNEKECKDSLVYILECAGVEADIETIDYE